MFRLGWRLTPEAGVCIKDREPLVITWPANIVYLINSTYGILAFLTTVSLLAKSSHMRRVIPSGLRASGSAASLPSRSCTRTSRAVFAITSRQQRCLHTSPALGRSSLSLNTTSTSFPTTHEALKPVDTPYFIDNQFVNSTTDKFVDLHDPATNNLVTRVPEMTDSEMEAAVASAEKAFESWSQTTVLTRQQIMFRFVHLIRENFERLAASCTLEQGKTLADGRGDVLRGIQIAEAAIAAPEFLKGELLEVSKDMETRSYREPLGVVSAICPFSE